MTDYESALSRFIDESRAFGERIHNDYREAASILEKIEKDTDFDSIIAQIKSDRLVHECRRFASLIKDWAENYPRVLDEFRKVLALIIDDLKDIRGVSISQSGRNISISFDEHDFIYYFEQNLPTESGKLSIREEDKVHIAKKENRIVQEIAEILSLDMHLEGFMEYLGSITESYKINDRASYVESVRDVNDSKFIENMHEIVKWWQEAKEITHKIKKVTFTAVEMDRKAARDLKALLRDEEKLNTQDARIKAAKSGAFLLSGIALNIIPGGGFISAIAEIIKERRVYAEALRSLRR